MASFVLVGLHVAERRERLARGRRELRADAELSRVRRKQYALSLADVRREARPVQLHSKREV